jgi:hypothetical protein
MAHDAKQKIFSSSFFPLFPLVTRHLILAPSQSR